MDRISPLFAHFSPSIRVFHSGRLCQHADFDVADGSGHLHLLRRGALAITDRHGRETHLLEPGVIFYPRACNHRFRPLDAQGIDLLCATVDLGIAVGNPLLDALPEVLVLPLGSLAELTPTLELLFAEGFGQRCGRAAALEPLMQYFLVLLLRHLIERGDIDKGLLRALAEPRLARAITAMHEQPAQAWSLESLAAVAGMSRARFAHHFRQVMGQPPLEYLSRFRMSIARELIQRGSPIKSAASRVGYESQASFSRAFTRIIGRAPRAWARQAATGSG